MSASQLTGRTIIFQESTGGACMKKHRKFKTKRTKVVEGGTSYTDWIDRKQAQGQAGEEPAQANPDVLDESAGLYALTGQQQEEAEAVRELVRQAPQFLTSIQARVFDGIKQGATFQTIADEMGKDVSTVYESWKAAQKKLQRRYADILEKGGPSGGGL